MLGNRFDALTKTWGRTRGTDGTSRRGVLSLMAGLALGGTRALHREAVAQEVGAERISCHGRCGQGETCVHGACVNRCRNPGTCSGGDSGGPPTCGPAGANCACVALRSGVGYCLSASKRDGCTSKGCRRNRNCPKGQVCAHVPGCCPNKPRICAIPCPAAAPEARQAGAFGG
jgi:hypothetical protein